MIEQTACPRCFKHIPMITAEKALAFLKLIGELSFWKHVTDTRAFVGRAHRMACRLGLHR